MGYDSDGIRSGRKLAALIGSCLVAVAGCASSGTPAAGTADVSPDVMRGSVAVQTNPEVVTGDDVRETGVGNLYEALRRLRPLWLQARAGGASLAAPRGTAPVVYVAGAPFGDLRSLQTMTVDRVRRVEFINARDATTRYGTGHSGGVILVDLDRE